MNHAAMLARAITSGHRALANELGLVARDRRLDRAHELARREHAWLLRAEGLKFWEIAERLGCSVERARQLVRQFGQRVERAAKRCCIKVGTFTIRIGQREPLRYRGCIIEHISEGFIVFMPLGLDWEQFGDTAHDSEAAAVRWIDEQIAEGRKQQ